MSTTATPTRERSLQVFYGEANAALARVYVYLPLPAGSAAATWQGWVRGPWSHYGHTLPARYALRATGVQQAAPMDGARLLAEAIVPDPCLWTPDEPYLYDVQVELRPTDQPGESLQQAVGIRPLGRDGPRLRLAGKNFVVRAAAPATLSAVPAVGDEHAPLEPDHDAALRRALAAWHHTATALWTIDPEDALCAAASEVGVLLLADLRAGDARALAQQIRRLARFPAVGIVIWPRGARWESAYRRCGPNLLFAQRVAPGEEYPEADLLLCDADAWLAAPPSEVANLAAQGVPCIATQAGVADRSAVELRAACDALQRRLSAQTASGLASRWAGYWVQADPSAAAEPRAGA